MKQLSALVVLIMVLSLAGRAQTKIPAAEAVKHIGEQTVVCGRVYGVKFLDKAKGEPTFLNVGAAYPNSPFTVVIFGETRRLLTDTPEKLYNGKNICVTGMVKEYKGKAEIVVSKVEEITVEP